MSTNAIKDLAQRIDETDKGQVLELDIDDCQELATLVKDAVHDEAVARFIKTFEFRRDILKVKNVLLERSDAEDVLYHAYEITLSKSPENTDGDPTSSL